VAAEPSVSGWRATILERDYQQLHQHLFQPDQDEHAAFLYAGIARSPAGSRLLVRQVHPVADHEFIASDRGAYRQIVPSAVARAARECDQLGLCLLWAHSHPGSRDRVGFSSDDLAAHRYAHPALIDITNGRPVAGLVFGTHAVAGEIWTTDDEPAPLESLRVIGRNLTTLRPEPVPTSVHAGRFARQVLMFGDAGQKTLRSMTVAVVGAGGGGSLVIQMLAHLGVGALVIIDPDTVEETNLSRIVGSTTADIGRPKVDVARDHAHRIDPQIIIDARAGDIAYADDARRLIDCDFAFLATDTVLSRYAFNLTCHQYLVPGTQIGAKVTADHAGNIELIHVMERPILLAGPCLECMGAIPPAQLRHEQQTPGERRAQAYVDDTNAEEIEEPSVITLNSISAALAATDFMLMATGLILPETTLDPNAYYPQQRFLRRRTHQARDSCRFCGTGNGSLLARGDTKPLSLAAG